MLNAREMREGLFKYANSPALFLYPWVLAWLAWMKNSGYQSADIPFVIPVVPIYDFSHPNEIPEKDCPFAIDGERYYFTKLVPRDASGNRSKRKAGEESKGKEGEEGAKWKSISTIKIKDLKGNLIGYMKKFTLYKGDKSLNWHMEEYRVHNHDLLDDPYVLCKIYDKDSCCPKYTDTSIRDLRNRIVERQLGSHPDQTNSPFDNRNQSQTQLDGSDSHEDIIMQPSTSHDASRGQYPPAFSNNSDPLYGFDDPTDWTYNINYGEEF